MNPIDLFMFDLDGTLIDTRDDLAASVNAVRVRAGLTPVDLPGVIGWVGDGASVLIGRALGVPDDRADEDGRVRDGLAFFREHYGAHMMDRARPYPGVPETLARLGESGRILTVVSNKPAAMCEVMLAELRLDGHFSLVIGGDSLDVRKPDPGPLRHVLAHHAIVPRRAAMVGDGTQDMLAGRAAGVTTVAALYGFRSREVLSPTRPDLWIESFSDLGDLF